MVVSDKIVPESKIIGSAKFVMLFAFLIAVEYQIIWQIWHTKKVNKKVIFGMMSGYISLGFIGFFIFLSQEIFSPGSFSGLIISDSSSINLIDRLMYFSYITLMTIGYGEITPVTELAQKATILVGFSGQFYLVIITAIIVGKFINQTGDRKKDE